MATIQHSALPNSELHEPKHILTSTTVDSGKVITPSSATNGTSQLRNLTLGDLSNSGASTWTGWAQYDESVKITEGTGLSLAAGVRTPLTIDGLGPLTNTDGLPTGVTEFWNTSTNKFTPAGLNDAYDLRLFFIAKCATSNAYLDVDLDIGGSIGILAQQSFSFVKSIDQYFNTNLSVFTAATFLANGGTFNITASHTTTLWKPKFLIVRTHKGS